MNFEIKESLINNVISVLHEAGHEVLRIYQDYQQQLDLKIEKKLDGSPLTEADLISNAIILSALKKTTPHILIISEEDSPSKLESNKDLFWLVDPLDGTKEFINANGEFTLNIALISSGVPILGFVYAPALNSFFWGGEGFGSHFYEGNQDFKLISLDHKVNINRPLAVVTSRSHSDNNLNLFLEKLTQFSTIPFGSSYKFCLVAKGEADIYPRLGPTCEWDTAAAQAVLTNAGGFVYDIQGKPLCYGKENYLNPFFFASRFPYSQLKSFYKL
jgi:3'(2'), 5'-bisphosphate nucleotidase